MEVNGWVVFGGVVVFFGGMFAYAMFMIFLPEWVGIAGKTSEAADEAHRGLSPEELAIEAARASAQGHDVIMNSGEAELLPSESVSSELVPEAPRLVSSQKSETND